MPRPSKGARLYFSRKDDRWLIRDTGQPDVGTGCSYGKRAAAERALQDYLSKKHRPDFGRGDPAGVLVIDVLTLYADERAEETKRPDVVWSALPHLIAFFDGKMVSHATPNVCRAYAKWRMAQPQARFKVGPEQRFTRIEDVPRVGDQTVRRELTVLSAAFGYAHKEHKLLYPVIVTMPDKKPALDRWLSRSDAARLIWTALGFRNVASDPKGAPRWRRPGLPGSSERLAARTQSRHVARFLIVGLYTGTRHEAILRLKWLPTTEGGFVDLRAGILYRRGQGEGESAKKRTPVPLSLRLLAHLRRWRDQSVSHVVEFEGEPIERLRRAWKTARLASGLGPEVTPHILRHTFATWAVRDGASFHEVALALGTSEKVVREVYGHHSP